MKLKKIFPYLFAIALFFIGGSDVFAYDFAHWKGATVTDFSIRFSSDEWKTNTSTSPFVWVPAPRLYGDLSGIYQFGGMLKVDSHTLKKGTATIQFALGHVAESGVSACSWINSFATKSLEYSTNKTTWSMFNTTSFNCTSQGDFIIIGYNVTIPSDITFTYLSLGVINDDVIADFTDTLFSAVNFISSEDGTQAIINQNQTIIDQNQTQIEQGQQTNENLEDIKDAIKNDNVNGVENAFESFEGFIAENSTITQLITMPITLYSSILNGMQATCQPFVLGNLLGTNLTIPCINIGNYLGNVLWSMIDIIISGFAIYSISKKLIKIFNNFSSMKEGDVIDD